MSPHASEINEPRRPAGSSIVDYGLSGFVFCLSLCLSSTLVSSMALGLYLARVCLHVCRSVKSETARISAYAAATSRPARRSDDDCASQLRRE
eukprot:2285555-Rhodomonas_salina.1